mgnify:FL=1
MRFEAKHSYFKKLANVIGNFKNVAQTLSYRHQHWMCYKLQTSNANLGTFVEKGVQVGPGKLIEYNCTCLVAQHHAFRMLLLL